MTIKRYVSMHNSDRLTYREAAALLGAANHGLADFEELNHDGLLSTVELAAAQRAVDKLKQALDKAGAYRPNGSFIDPFPEEEA